jgi:putative membrane protein
MIKKIVIGVALNALALYAVTYFLNGIQYSGDIKFFLIGGLIIGCLNTFVKPLMKLLSFPLMIITVGFFSIVINAIIFWLAMKGVNIAGIPDVHVVVTGAWTYLTAGIVFGLVNGILHIFIRNN